MGKIAVKVRSDIGDPGVHLKYGALKPGETISIDEEDFGAGLFDRPHAEFLSIHEEADKTRAAEEKQKVGDFEPPENKERGARKASNLELQTSNLNKEVIDNA